MDTFGWWDVKRMFRRRRNRIKSSFIRRWAHLETLEERRLLSGNQIDFESPSSAIGPAAVSASLTPIFLETSLAGSMVRQAAESEEIVEVDEVDTLVLDLDEGQILSVLTQPNATLQVEVTVKNASSTVVGQSTATEPGESILLQTLPIITAGAYTIEITGQGTTGSYDIELFLNAAIEDETVPGQSNNNSATNAQDLGSSFITLGGGLADRAALVGQRDEDLIEKFEHGLPTGNWNFTSSDAGGLIEVNEEILAADGRGSLLMTRSTVGVNNLNEATWTVNLSTVTSAVLHFSHTEFDDEQHSLPSSFQGSANGDGISISQNGTNWFRIFNPSNLISGLWQSVSIDLSEAANNVGIAFDADFHIRFQQFDNGSLTEFRDGRAFDGIRLETDPVVTPSDWYRFELEDGQSASFVLNGTGVDYGDGQMRLRDANENLLATHQSGDNAAAFVPSYQDRTTNGLTDTYFLEVISALDDYTLVVTRDADFDQERNSTLNTAQSIARSNQMLGFVDTEPTASLEILQEFPSIDYTTMIPPDPIVAVGYEQVITLVNSEIAIHDKATGEVLFEQSISGPSGFFGDVGSTRTVFDPWIIYDDDSERFFIVAIDIAGREESNVYLAVSTSPTPTKGTDWHKHKINFAHNPETLDLGLDFHFPDYEKLGVNDDAVFMTGNYGPIFTGVGIYSGITAFDKASLVSGNAPQVLFEDHFNGLSVFPLNQFGSGSTQYFAESRVADNVIRIHAVTDVLTNPQRHTFDVPVPAFDAPIDVPQLGGGTPVESVGERIMTGVWRNGSAWFAHGIRDPAIGDGENVARWYEIATNDFPVNSPTLVQAGNVDPGPSLHAWMPGLAVDGQGNMAIGFSHGGPNEYPGAGFTGRLASDPPGQTTLPVNVFVEGLGNYQRIDGSGRNRWGDYTGMVVDPSDDTTFWAYNLFSTPLNTWATQVASFQVEPIPDVDVIEIDAQLGDQLQIQTFTPFDGLGDLQNGLDPQIELYDPLGNSLELGVPTGDGRNETLNHQATQTGRYRLVVRSQSAAGAYFLSVDGATGDDPVPEIVSTNPGGQLVASYPATFQVTFSEAIDVTSVDPSDLTVDGVPATGAAVEGHRIVFTLDVPISPVSKIYDVVMAAGAVRDLQGNTTLDALTTSFTVDVSGPKINATRWNGADFPADTNFAPGVLQFEADMDEDILILASARRGPLSPASDDVDLIDLVTGQDILEEFVVHDNDTNVFRADYDLPEGNYRLTLNSAIGAFADAAGNILDGEPNGSNLDGTVTGNGVAGGDYSIDFTVDVENSTLNEFLDTPTLGGLVAVSRDNPGYINSETDFDTFSFFGLANQTIAIDLTHEPAPRAYPAVVTLQLIDENDNVLATVISPKPGNDPIAMPATSLPADGTYRVQVSATRTTRYRFDVWRNAELESAVVDTHFGSELPIDISHIDVASGRWAVVGVAKKEFEFTQYNDGSKFIDISNTGLSTRLAEDENISLITSVGNELMPAGQITVGNNGGLLASFLGNLYFVNLPLPAPDIGRALLVYWDDLDTSSESQISVQEMEIDGVEMLIVQWSDLPHFQQIGAATFQVQIFNSGDLMARMVYPDVVFGDPTLDNGATATIGYQESQNLGFEYLFGAADVNIDPPLLPNRFIANNDVIDLRRAPDIDEYTLDLSGHVGKPLDITLAGLGGTDMSGELLEILDDAGNIVAISTGQPLGVTPQGFEQGILDFVVPNIGTNVYTIRVISFTTGQYSVIVTESLTFDTEPNESGSDPLRLVSKDRSGLGHLAGAGDQDRYHLQVTNGEIVRVTATALYDHPSLSPLNTLDAEIQVLAADGTTILAEDLDSLDGKNATATWISAVDEEVTVVVTSTTGDGTYLLDVEPISNPPVVTLSIDSPTIDENDGTTRVDARLSSVWNEPITIDLAFSGDAILVDDFTIGANSIVIPPNTTSGSTTVTAVNNELVEADKTVVIDISNVTNATESGEQQVTTTILDDDISPEVDLVRLRDPNWSPVFVNEFAADGLGYPVFPALDPKSTIPWTTINEVTVQFTKDVGASLSIASFTLEGTTTAYAIDSLAYDAIAFRATLGFATPLPTDRYTLTVNGATVADLFGNPLPGNTLVSFDISASDFVDTDGTGAVGLADLSALGFSWDTSIHSEEDNFDPLKYVFRTDANGDGRVTLVDLATLGSNWQSSLP